MYYVYWLDDADVVTNMGIKISGIGKTGWVAQWGIEPSKKRGWACRPLYWIPGSRILELLQIIFHWLSVLFRLNNQRQKSCDTVMMHSSYHRGSSARFSPSAFFHEYHPSSLLIHNLKLFRIRLWIHLGILILNSFCTLAHGAESNLYLIWDEFKHAWYMLGWCTV
jgi:hypothetical protein